MDYVKGDLEINDSKVQKGGNLSSRDLMRGLSLPSQTPTAPRQKATHFPKPPLPLRGSANSFSLMSDPSSTLYQSPSDFQAAMRQFTTPEHSAHQQLQQLSRQQLSSQDLSGQHVSQLSHHFSKQTAMLMQQMSAEQGHGMHPRLSSGHLPAPRNFSGQGSMHMPTQAVAGHPRAPQNFSSPGSTHVPPSPVSGALDYALNPEAGHSPAHRTFSGPSCMHMPPPAVSGHPPGPQNFSSPGSMHMPPSPVSGALDYPLSSEAARPMWSMPMGMQPGHLGFLPPPSHGFPDSPLPSPPGFNPEAAAALGMDMIPEHLRCLPTVVWWRIMHLVEASSAVTLQDFDEKVVLKMVALIDRFGQAECLLMLEQLEARLTSKHISMKNAAGYLDVAVNGHIDALMMRSNTTSSPLSAPELSFDAEDKAANRNSIQDVTTLYAQLQAVSSAFNPTCIEEVVRTTLTPMGVSSALNPTCIKAVARTILPPTVFDALAAAAVSSALNPTCIEEVVRTTLTPMVFNALAAAAVSSSVNPTCIEEVARTTLTPMVFDALSAAVRSKRWMKWDEHIDLAIVQLLKRLPADTAVQRLNEVQRRSFHGVGNVRGCINSIICPRSKERTLSSGTSGAWLWGQFQVYLMCTSIVLGTSGAWLWGQFHVYLMCTSVVLGYLRGLALGTVPCVPHVYLSCPRVPQGPGSGDSSRCTSCVPQLSSGASGAWLWGQFQTFFSLFSQLRLQKVIALRLLFRSPSPDQTIKPRGGLFLYCEECEPSSHCTETRPVPHDLCAAPAFSLMASQAGVLTVLCEFGKDLDNVKDLLPQNPFCIISIGDEEEKTHPHEDSKITPVWFEHTNLNVKNETEFSIEVYHYSDGDGESKFIGSGKGDLTQVHAHGWDREQQVTLQFSKKDPWEPLPIPSSQQALAASTLKSIAWEQFSKMVEDEREVWKQAFDGMDSDESGTLSVEEVQSVLTPIFSNHNIKPCPEGIFELFHFLDTDGDKLLEFEEMVAMRTIFKSPICQCCLKWTLSDNVWACRDCCAEHLLTPDIEKDESKWGFFGTVYLAPEKATSEEYGIKAAPRSEDVVTSQVATPSEEDDCVICQGAKSNAGFLHGDSMH
eukprot:gene23652-9185_t